MVRIYNEKEIETMSRGGKILAKIMEELKNEVKPGVTTNYLNKVAKNLVFSVAQPKDDSRSASGGSVRIEPSFLGYDNYPAALCTSINEEIVHALPSERKLKEGDILSLDLGLRYKGYCTDMAITLPVLDPTDQSGRTRVGKISQGAGRLIKVTKKSLELGIKQAKAGKHLGDIGWAIQNYAEKNNFNVIRELVGHGVGRGVHEAPQIPNYGKKGTGPELVEGMVLAIEPMLCVGDWHIEKCKDGFGYKTKDKSLSCHFEHTIVITKKGPLVLTQ